MNDTDRQLSERRGASAAGRLVQHQPRGRRALSLITAFGVLVGAVVLGAPASAFAAEPDIGPAPGLCPAGTPSPYRARHDFCVRVSDHAEVAVAPAAAGNGGQLTMTLSLKSPECPASPTVYPCVDAVRWITGQIATPGPAYRLVTQTGTHLFEIQPGIFNYYQPFALANTTSTSCNGGNPKPTTAPSCTVQIQHVPGRGPLVAAYAVLMPAVEVLTRASPTAPVVRTTDYVEAVFRFLLEPAPNTPPTAAFTARPVGATTVSFSGSGSSDSEGPIGLYTWNFGDGTPIESSSSSSVNHTYATAGTYPVTLTVTDGGGLTGSVTNNVSTASTQLVVNSTADTPDENASTTNDDVCATGVVLTGGAPECTLRAALQTALLRAGSAPSITFAMSGPSIIVGSALPVFTRPVQIDGTTQTGGFVELNGGGLAATGLDVRGGSSTISGLVINRFAGPAIALRGPGGNTLAGNRLGTDMTGTAALANQLGILIDGSPGNTIGGSTPADVNIISGNQGPAGLELHGGIVITGAGASANQVLGNRIGLSSTGQLLVNSDGVAIKNASSTTIGTDAARNWIAASAVGVAVDRGNQTRVVGNQIGTDQAGTSAVATAVFGVVVAGSDGVVVSNNQIAGSLVNIGVISSAGAQVAGNTVGLTPGGLAVPAGGSCPDTSFGIRIDGSTGAEVTNNRVAGHGWDVVVSGSVQVAAESRPDGGCNIFFGSPDSPLAGGAETGRDVTVSNNTIGLGSGGTPPTGVVARSGVTVYGGANRVNITGNTVSGHTATEVRIDNGGAHTIGQNTITAGAVTPVAGVGVRVRSATDVSVEGNVIAGHLVKELGLEGGSGHIVRANRIGTASGADGGSVIGIEVGAVGTLRIGGPSDADGNIISGNRDVGIRVLAVAADVLVERNRIGTDIGGNGAWPNGSGIVVQRGATGVRINHNLVSGNTATGIDLAASASTLTGNRIGVRQAGGALGNNIGVHVRDASAVLTTNTVAHNLSRGVLIDGTAPVTIRSGPIFDNGDRRGIFYSGTATTPATTELMAMRTSLPGGAVVMTFGIIAPDGGPMIVEVFGNTDCSDPEGRVPMFIETIPDGVGLLRSLTAAEFSAFGQVQGITATATGPSGATSAFSTCMPVRDAGDADLDGIEDVFERFGPNKGDNNRDGIRDDQQPGVGTIETSGGWITLVAPPGTTLQNVGVFNPTGVSVPPDLHLPYGLIRFDVVGLAPGATAVVDVLTPAAPLAAQQYIKFIPAADGSAGLYRVPEFVAGGQGAERTTSGWRLHFTDGGDWDVDRTANGRLRDPGGPGIVGATPIPIGPPPSAPRLAISATTALAVPAAGRNAAVMEASGDLSFAPGASATCGESVTIMFGGLTVAVPGREMRPVFGTCVWAGRLPSGFVGLVSIDLRRGKWLIAGGGQSLTFGPLDRPVIIRLTIGDDGGSTSVALRNCGAAWRLNCPTIPRR